MKRLILFWVNWYERYPIWAVKSAVCVLIMPLFLVAALGAYIEDEMTVKQDDSPVCRVWPDGSTHCCFLSEPDCPERITPQSGPRTR